MTSSEVQSPCIGVCVLDMEDVCEGCFRTALEIGSWMSMSESEKAEVVKLSWQRASDSGKLL